MHDMSRNKLPRYFFYRIQYATIQDQTWILETVEYAKEVNIMKICQKI